MPRGIKNRNVSGFFEIWPNVVPREYGSIVTTSAQSPYPTSTPAMMSASVEDQAFIRYCIENRVLPCIVDAWMCTLVPCFKMMLRNSSFLHGRWFVGWQTASESCLLGLLVGELEVNGSQLYVMCKVDQYYFSPILQPTQWQCCPFVWASPLRAFLQTGRWCQQSLGQAIRQAENLPEMSSRFGFWSLPKTASTRIATRMRYAIDNHAPLPQMIL